MERNFTFIHGPTGTEFGSVTLAIEGEIKLNGKAVGPNAMAHFLGYMAQSLQDQYAGVGKTKTVPEAQARFDVRLSALIDDTVGVRTGGAVDDETANRRFVVKQVLTENKKAGDKSAVEYLAKIKNDASFADELWDRIYSVPEYAADLDKRLAARVEYRAERKRLDTESAAKLSGSVSIKI